MASICQRKDSPFSWMSYKDPNGRWKNINTGYRKDNFGTMKQAELLAKEKSIEEQRSRPVSTGAELDSCVFKWIAATRGDTTKGQHGDTRTISRDAEGTSRNTRLHNRQHWAANTSLVIWNGENATAASAIIAIAFSKKQRYRFPRGAWQATPLRIRS
jgi:hypothetical protein